MSSDLAELLEPLRRTVDHGVRITGIRQLTAGHSNETYLLEGLDRVLRVQPRGPALMGEYDLPGEHARYRAIRRQPVAPPVPEMYDLCTDQTVIGSAFFVMERCRGDSTDWEPPEWLTRGGAALRDRVCEQWIHAVAVTHAMDPGTFASEPVPFADRAGRWRALAADADAPDRLLRILDDLVADPPPPSGPPACVHGDAKLANFLWDEGALITVLDWEMAYVGDPLYDLGYIVALMPSTVGERGFPPFNDLPGWWNRGRILDTWENHTGRSAEHVGRYEVLAMGMVTTLFARGIQLVRRGESCDPRYVGWERSLPWFLDRMQERAQAPIP